MARLLFVLLILIPVFAQAKIAPDWKYAEARLKKAKFKKEFIAALKKQYEAYGYEQTLELNVLLFMRKHDDHGVQVSKDAVETVKAFMAANRLPLTKAEKEHGVDARVIASLLWLESRHGVNRGKFHVPSVYLHLLQAPKAEVVAHLLKASSKFTPHPTKKQLDEVKKRTVKKADWAIVELKALEKIHFKDPARVKKLRGSFAGAFGIPQFIPSSYLKWARGQNKSVSPDLDKTHDAIHSVAFYLKDNGWRKGKDKTFVKALKRYNNSEDYANAILKLAQGAGMSYTREPASTKRKKN